MNVTVVYDNYVYHEGFTTAWGFSCVIREIEKTLLFDTGGDGSVLLANMQKAGIEPAQIESLVLSHQHWDHCGGVYHFLNKKSQLRLYLPHSFSDHYKDDLKRYSPEIIEVQAATKICDRVYSSGDMKGKIREQALFIQTARGLIVITGCAHPGIINIIKTAKEFLQDEILLVLGGFHLLKHNRPDLERAVADFRDLGVQNVAPTHCSGDITRQILEEAYGSNYILVGVGKTLTLDDIQ
jgi:7,8-dihydropterin-6-yl-methyl-4-(beta-D-ribofuranosyl)aminobenzene 5'-phosphate synthase